MFWVAKRAGFALLATMLLLTQFQPSFAADTSAPTFSPTVTSRQDGFFFVINNFVNTQTYSAVTTNGYVMLGYPSFGTGYGGSTSNYVGIVYGLNKGETATVTVTASRATYNSTSSQISGSAEVAPAVSSCSPTSTTSGFYTTLKFTATSETVDKFCDWTVPAGVSNATTVVIVGGGGGGGYWGNAGSGGAGAVLTRDNYPLTPGAVIRIVVGAGGARTFQGTGQGPGHNGNNSIFDGIVAAGGGGAGGGDSSHPPRFCNGFNGGSGGGTNSDAACATSAGAAKASEICNCSGTWTIYSNSGSGQSGGSAGSSGAGVSLLGLTFGARSSSIASTGNSGNTNTAGSSGVVIVKYFLQPTSTVSINSISAIQVKGSVVQLTAVASNAGKVRFYDNGKRIPGCISISTSGSPTLTATCNWKVPVISKHSIYATLTPTDSNVLASRSTDLIVDAKKRTNSR